MSILSQFKFIIFALVSSLLFTACSSSPSISSLIGGRQKYDYAQNFEQMSRYNFKPAPDTLSANSNFIFIQDAGAILAIENGMAGKKISKERNMTPDFLVNYYYTGDKNITAGQLNQLFSYNLSLAWNDKYGTGLGIADSSHSFSKGTLIIDFVLLSGLKMHHDLWRVLHD